MPDIAEQVLRPLTGQVFLLDIAHLSSKTIKFKRGRKNCEDYLGSCTIRSFEHLSPGAVPFLRLQFPFSFCGNCAQKASLINMLEDNRMTALSQYLRNSRFNAR